MKIRIQFIILCLIGNLYSCSTTKIEEPGPTQYSSQTEKEFNAIEEDEAQILERYRELRKKNWDNYVNKNKNTVDYVRQRSKNVSTPRKISPPVHTPAPIPELTEEESKALEIELNQRKSIFCMKSKTLKRFDDEADCLAFVENNHYECIQRHGEKSKLLVNCLKGKLK